MRLKRFGPIAIVCALVLVGIFIQIAQYVPPPTLSFVEVRMSQYGQVAVYRATNTSAKPFSYLSDGPSMAWFYRRVSTASGYRPEGIYTCGTGVGYIELPPHTSRELEISLFSAPSPSTLGIYFEQGTPADIERRATSRFGDLWYFILRLLPTPDPTWSDTPH